MMERTGGEKNHFMKKSLSRPHEFFQNFCCVAPRAFQLPICLAIFATLLFSWLAIEWGFCLTNASDPLDYVGPALMPEDGFRYLDRILNWMWIRFIAVLFVPLAPETVGPVSTLLLSSATLFLATWWLAARVQILAGSIFASLFIISPAWLPIATYTYPVQGMTLVIVSTLILMDLVGDKKRAFVGGFGGGLASFCKIQGVTFFGYLLFDSLMHSKQHVKKILLIGIGGLLSFFGIFILIAMVDGFAQIQRILHLFFDGTAKAQFHGRGLSGMSPFHAYLFEPAYICAFAGMFLPWLTTDLKKVRPFALAAIVQIIGLLVIYFITQRGGPLIPNYVLDTFTLGVVAFSASVVCIFKMDRIPSAVQQTLGFSLLLVVFMVVNYFGINLPHSKLYFASKLLSSELLTPTMMVWFAFLPMLILVIFQKELCSRTSVFFFLVICSLGSLILGIGFRGGEGVKEAVFRKEVSLPYHEIARMVEKLSSDSVLVKVGLGQGGEKGSQRVRRVFRAFYSGKDEIQKKNVFWGQNDSGNFRYILTDQVSDVMCFIGAKYSQKLLPSNKDFEIPVSALKELNLNLKIKGSRGDATLVWQNSEMALAIKPLSEPSNLTMLLDVSPISKHRVHADDVLLLSAASAQAPADVFVRLYVQFVVNGKSVRRYGEENENVHTLWEIIPENAEIIHYGWYIKTEKLEKTVKLLSPIMVSYKNLKQGRFPVALIDQETKTILFDSVGSSR